MAAETRDPPHWWGSCPQCGGMAVFARVDGQVTGACHALGTPCYWVGEGAAAARAATQVSDGARALTQLQAALQAPAGTQVRVVPGERFVLVQLTDTARGASVVLETGLRVGEGLSPAGMLDERVRQQVQEQLTAQALHLNLWDQT